MAERHLSGDSEMPVLKLIGEEFQVDAGSFIFVTDETDAPADFVLLDLLRQSLTRGERCVFFSFSDALAHWKAIASKMYPSLDLSRSIKDSSLTFIEHLNEFLPNTTVDADVASSTTYRMLDVISCIIATSSLVIIENISFLEWLGLSSLSVFQFVRAIYAACSDANATLVVRLRLITSDPDDLMQYILQICMVHVRTVSLASGKSSFVGGEITVHRGAAALEGANNPSLLPGLKILQYHVSDNVVSYFDRGTSTTVL